MHIAHVEWNPPGPDWDGEYVLIENRGADSQDMTGWTLGDTNNHTYFFPDGFILADGAEVRVWTRSGVDTNDDLFWGRSSAVWGNEGDAAYLRDDMGTLIDFLSWSGGLQ